MILAISTLLLIASSAWVAAAQECPSGYEPNTGTIPENQTIDWVACPVEDQPTLECATLDVPLDYTDLSLGTLTLPLVRLPAPNATGDGQSIFHNPGGPGGSGIKFIIESGDSLLT